MVVHWFDDEHGMGSKTHNSNYKRRKFQVRGVEPEILFKLYCFACLLFCVLWISCSNWCGWDLIVLMTFGQISYHWYEKSWVLGTVNVTYGSTWILGIIWGQNCVHLFGAMFSIVWHGVDYGLDLVAMFVCVKSCRILQFSLKRARLA